MGILALVGHVRKPIFTPDKNMNIAQKGLAFGCDRSVNDFLGSKRSGDQPRRAMRIGGAEALRRISPL